jgi:hypothetical protein
MVQILPSKLSDIPLVLAALTLRMDVVLPVALLMWQSR